MFLLRFTDVPDSAELRATHRDAHLDWLDSLGDAIVAAGVTATPDGGPGLGSVWIVRAPDAEAALALADTDPFVTSGMRATREVFTYAGRAINSH